MPRTLVRKETEKVEEPQAKTIHKRLSPSVSPSVHPSAQNYLPFQSVDILGSYSRSTVSDGHYGSMVAAHVLISQYVNNIDRLAYIDR